MIKTFRESLRLLSVRQRFLYIVLVGARALSSFLDILGIALIGLVTGLAATSIDPNQPIKLLGWTIGPVSQEEIVWLVGAVLIVFALKAAIAITLIRATTIFLARVESINAARVAHILLSGNLSNLHRYSKGDIVWASMGSVSIATSGVLQTLATFVAEGSLLILVGIMFFVVDPVASLFVCAYFAIIIITIQLVIGKILSRAGTDAAEGNSRSVEILDDAIGAFREVTVLGKQHYFIGLFQGARQQLASSLGVINFLGGMPRYVVETALMLGVVVFVGAQFLSGQLASGLVTVGVFLTGGVRIMASLLPLQNAMASSKTQAEQAKLAFSILEGSEVPKSNWGSRTSAVNARDFTLSADSPALSVEIRDVSFSYQDAVEPALSDISISIPSGSHVAIIGPSGAGKTTLVDLILGLLEPSKGKILIDGVEPDHESLLENHLISYVPQRPGIVSGTIAQNVAFGVPAEQIDEDRVNAALRKAHLGHFVDSLTYGIHTSVGSQADALSGGQIQRLGLARALYTDPKLIVLDEATSALDASSEALVSESIRDLGNSVTVIVIAHRLSTIQHSDVVFVVDDGKVIGSGNFAHIRETVPMIAEYVELMSFD